MAYWIWALVVVALIYIIFEAYKCMTYFNKWGIPHPLELPFFGTMGFNLFYQQHINHMVNWVYNLNKEAKYIGMHSFFTPTLLIRDLELIKSVLVKNFDHFADHRAFLDEKADPLFAKNLAFVNGDKWKELRSLLSPAFTSSKMRAMYVLMSNCAENFSKSFLEKYKDEEAINMKDAFTKFANDVIATCAFGIEVDSIKNPDNQFYRTGTNAAAFQKTAMMKFMLILVFPKLSKLIGMRFISKQDTDFFIDVIKTTVKTRDEQGITRPDVLQLMMDARSTSKLDIVDMTAQAFIFFLGGFDSTSNQMCLIAHELAVNPDVQEKLQAEIDAVMDKSNGKPTYEDVNGLPYLDAVFAESLRLHPIGLLSRLCTKEFEMPPAVPGAKPYIVKPGMEVNIAVAGIHSDPDIYPHPERFEPERFLDKKWTMSDVTNLGFGMGPRGCIGNRFAILETKVLMVHVLHKCSVVPCKKSCVPMVYDKAIFAPIPKDGFWFKIKPRI